MASLPLAQKRLLLSRASLFSSLAEKDLETLASVAQALALKSREELFRKGEEGSQVYIVARGKLEVITTSSDGDDLMFCVLGEGEVI
jgi:CRP-like cAMP-binding protein